MKPLTKDELVYIERFRVELEGLASDPLGETVPVTMDCSDRYMLQFSCEPIGFLRIIYHIHQNNCLPYVKKIIEDIVNSNLYDKNKKDFGIYTKDVLENTKYFKYS